jgi:hypothetical protein
MALKDRVSSNVAVAPGFNLAPIQTVRYSTLPDFQKALKAQETATTLLDSRIVTDIDIDGNLIGTDEDGFAPLRLSKNAFSDLCRHAKIGESFVKRRVDLNENLTLALMRDCISHEFRDGDFRLIVNTDARRVEGIVEAAGYVHLPNAKCLEYAMATQKDLALSQAWIEGAETRFALIDKKKPFEARKGDIINFGVSVGSFLKNNGLFTVTDYNERLVCTNGMMRREEGLVANITHSGDLKFDLQRAVVTSHTRSSSIIGKIKESTTKLLRAEEIRKIRLSLTDTKLGGSPSFAMKITKAAMIEAEAEGRTAEEPTLWNFVNAVTAAAHDTSTLIRRTAYESMGYAVLAAA